LNHCELDFRNYWGNRQIRINVVEVAQVDADALIAEYIAQQLERRVSFRRVVRQQFSAPSALVSKASEFK